MFPPLLLLLAAPVRLMAVGDVMLDRYVGRAIAEHSTSYPLERVRGLFSAADLVVGNLECPITSRPKVASKHFVFRASPDAAPALRGFDVLSVANNHSLDCGAQGLEDTAALLRKLGIAPAGVSGDPPVLIRKGLRIAFLGFCDFRDSRSGIDYYESKSAASRIRQARSRADLVVVFMHWGDEGRSDPSPRQRQEAKELSTAGADLILGSHPHVLQPVERIGNTVVAYSLGNFVFDATKEAERRTGILSLEITAQGVRSWKLIPCRIEHARPTPSASGQDEPEAFGEN